jgi:hypothetical protein
MYIPTIMDETAAVRIWLSRTKKKYQDDWKKAVSRAIVEDCLDTEHIHPLVRKHLHRKKP